MWVLLHWYQHTEIEPAGNGVMHKRAETPGFTETVLLDAPNQGGQLARVSLRVGAASRGNIRLL